MRALVVVAAGVAGAVLAWWALGGDVTAAIAGAVAGAIAADSVRDVVDQRRARREAYRRWAAWQLRDRADRRRG